jgi:O-antigen/teichoic acid export membrane protein
MGIRWAGTAPTTQILAAACMIGVFGEAVTPLLLAQGRADRAFQLEAIQSTVRLILLWPLIQLFGTPGVALAWLGGNAASQVAGAMYVRDVLRISLGGLAPRRLLAGVMASVIAAAVASGVGAVLHGFAALVVGGGAAVLVAGGTLWLLDQAQGLRLQELLPWHATWGPPAALQPPGQVTLDA